jgi:hypothetical protein
MDGHFTALARINRLMDGLNERCGQLMGDERRDFTTPSV